MSSCAERIADNRLRASAARRLDRPSVALAFMCECRNAFCTDPVVLRLGEYERLAADPDTAFITLRHTSIDGRTVVAWSERYAVVAGDAAPA
jgi:hypothetical protein